MKMVKVYTVTNRHCFLALLVFTFITEAMGKMCRDPSDDVLDQLKSRQRGGGTEHHWSFGLIPSPGSSVMDLSRVHRRYIRTQYSHWHGNASCPFGHARRDRQPGSCETYYVIEFDENRIPQTALQAKCRCRNCHRHRYGFEPEAGRCERRFAYSSVLRRVGCINGVYDYAVVLEPIAIGCYCALPCEDGRYVQPDSILDLNLPVMAE